MKNSDSITDNTTHDVTQEYQVSPEKKAMLTSILSDDEDTVNTKGESNVNNKTETNMSTKEKTKTESKKSEKATKEDELIDPKKMEEIAEDGDSRIYKTTDYEMFNYTEVNRNIDIKHIDNLVKSIERKNLIPSNPIIVNSDMTVMDGQHRLEALRVLGLPVYYKVDNNFDIDDISFINTVEKKWNLEAYLKHYVGRKYGEYEKLNSFISSHDVNIYSAIGLLSGRTSQPNSELIQNFKSGNFVVKDEEYAEKVLKMRDDFSKFHMAKNFYKSKTFLNALSKISRHPKYEHDKMISKVEIRPDMFYKHGTIDGYINMLQSIYNYKSKNDVYFTEN